MCIICVSPSGTQQPSVQKLYTMFKHNPHGAGYMFARDGKVYIHKGFMDFPTFLDAVNGEHFTAADSVVYHFRISTQAGINPEMTHPFPLANRRALMRVLDLGCSCGIAHNGIIRLTSDPKNRWLSDTAIFITDYLTKIIRKPEDLRNQKVLDKIYYLAESKFAIMDASGYVATVGDFVKEHGNLYSNRSYEPYGLYNDRSFNPCSLA